MNAKRALFLDRDGVINLDKGYVHRKENFDFVAGIFNVVRRANFLNYLVIVVTNQAGIGRGYYSEEEFRELMAWVGDQFVMERAKLDGVYFCPHHPEHGIGRYRCQCNSRKPGPGMFLRAAVEMNIDLAGSVMIGDRMTDMRASYEAGVQTRLLLRRSFDADDIEGANLQTAAIENLDAAIPYLRS